jgi:hypothetical protein
MTRRGGPGPFCYTLVREGDVDLDCGDSNGVIFYAAHDLHAFRHTLEGEDDGFKGVSGA